MLESFAKSDKDTNKYYIGRSSGLAELVEYIFLTILESNKYTKDQQFQIMENRMRIVECCSAPLLNCLKEALPYHAEPSLIKRYLKIVANLAYSIRETDSAKLRMNNEDVDLRETSSVASNKQVFTRGK